MGGEMTVRTVLPLLALAVVFILYGSLHPFDFRPLETSTLWEAVAAAWMGARPNRGDVLANLLLYLPLGWLVAASLRDRPPLIRLAVAAFAGLLLSTGIELAQLYDRGRTSSPWDVLCNTVGALAGAVLALFVATRGPVNRPRIPEPLAAVLVLAWLGYRFYPYLPSIDLQAWRDNLKPLLLYPVFEPGRTLRLATAWTVAALLVEAAFGRAPARLLVPLGLAVAPLAEVIIPGKGLTLAEVLAPGLAWAAWLLLSGRRRVAPVMIAATLGLVLAEWLDPFIFAMSAREFGWIPFRAVMNGSSEAAVQAILGKLFFLGAALWWLSGAGLRLPVAAAILAVIVCAASLIQTVIPGRSAEISDTLLVFALAGAFHLARPATMMPRTQTSWRQRAAVRQADPMARSQRRSRA